MSFASCENCGKEIESSKKTCNRLCADELKKKKSRENRICLVCGGDFLVRKKDEKKICSAECRSIWMNRPENKASRIEKSQYVLKSKYGEGSFLSTEEFKSKARQTKINRYGDENYVNNEQSKQTKKDRYGDENYNNQSKMRETKKSVYGDEGYNNRPAANQTSMDRYGEIHAMKKPEFIEKSKITLMKNFGVDSPIKNEEIKSKIVKTNKDRYGFNTPSKNSEVRGRIRQHYVDNFLNTKIHDKINSSSVEIVGGWNGISRGGVYLSYEFKCKDCGGSFMSTLANNMAPICRTCYPIYKNNSIQIELAKFLSDNGIVFFENVKNTIKPYELDFFIPSLNFAIEINGNYYHSEIAGGKGSEYHIGKTRLCNEKGIRLIHVFEDEWICKKEIVKSMIISRLSATKNKVFARSCNVVKINHTQRDEFLNENHIQGSNTSDSIQYALVKSDSIICVMSFCKPRVSLGQKNKGDGVFELSRFCSKKDFLVVGGFTRLLKKFIEEYRPSKIITYADCRYSGIDPENTVYLKNGFVFTGLSKPNYWYMKKNDYMKRYHRFSFRKSELLKVLNKPELTEFELASEIGMDRIWDCGNLKFEMIF